MKLDREYDRGTDIENMSAPLRQRGEDVAGCGGECCFGTVAHAFDTKLVGEGKMFELVHEPGNTLGQILREAAEIAENRWQAEPEEECNAAEDTDEQNDNDDWTGEVIACRSSIASSDARQV